MLGGSCVRRMAAPACRVLVIVAATGTLLTVMRFTASAPVRAASQVPRIKGYPDRPSVLPGGVLQLHVSSETPFFRVDFYRQGITLGFIASSGWMPGQNRPPDWGSRDWGWPGYDFRIPDDWSSGVYIAMFIGADASGRPISVPDATTPDGLDKALFVVRSADPGRSSSILYKLSWTTFHAYNYSGWGSLYRHILWSSHDSPPGYKVTTHRPGGGTGGIFPSSEPPDFYDPTSPRQTFAHWDAPFISWLETNGYPVDYCTDLDLHEDPAVLTGYNLLLSVGHDEYWSDAMRQNVESFIQNGGNVAFFSGNICWWRIHFVDHDTAFTCDKRTGADQWYRFRPENSMTGVSFRNGGSRYAGPREAVGYKVQHADHWVYDGTGLQDGDVFGADKRFPLVGYECDGAELRYDHGVAMPTGRDGTPLDFLILGLGALGRGTPSWQDLNGDHTATMGLYTRPGGGTVFTAATIDWVKLLSRNQHVDRITRNVLDHLSMRDRTPSPATRAAGGG